VDAAALGLEGTHGIVLIVDLAGFARRHLGLYS
jgi:hypothetical protein